MSNGRSSTAARFLLLALLALSASLAPVRAQRATPGTANESRIPVGNGSLYVREIGQGPAIIVLHGGPDFDHAYLLPDLDRLADSYRLIYYDQRGRGLSAAHVDPADVSLASELDDLDRVRQHFHLETVTLLGHSWGTELALEYALRHPEHVSHLILMDPGPASAADYANFRKAYVARQGPDLERQNAIRAGDAYKSGDPAAVTARYRLHFRPAFARQDAFERLMTAMNAQFIAQGSAGIIEARAVEDRLRAETWERSDYDLLPALRTLNIPTAVIGGEQDFIPPFVAEHIAHAIPNARLTVLGECGHFSYIECPTGVRRAIDALMRREVRTPR